MVAGDATGLLWWVPGRRGLIVCFLVPLLPPSPSSCRCAGARARIGHLPPRYGVGASVS
ncbi:hypothetical protein PR003_g24881 [Phytophthora rubi]|uniref:Uncharacterized protein n=1 Tax=Phytophthora rubi TaxID=129364 RepID=A0A6A3N9N3_9STRA|nr:hypothetical protein PR002_g23799 [Phytophthora rubi]KAE9038292.1 hypothetical protein PR001_g8013 [Phytophthora rubi]KAE9291981.1 hypothetical protein PR003_g24881 [Phytophthora rubi]